MFSTSRIFELAIVAALAACGVALGFSMLQKDFSTDAAGRSMSEMAPPTGHICGLCGHQMAHSVDPESGLTLFRCHRCNITP